MLTPSCVCGEKTDLSLLCAIVEGSPVAMVVVTPERRISMVNAQTETLFGYLKEELIGQSSEVLVPERFRIHHAQLYSAFLTSPRSRSMGVGRDLVGRRRNGSEIPVEISLTPLHTSFEDFVLVSMLDISERKRVTDDLERALQQKNTLLQEVHHRVKNNLQVLSSLVRLQRESLHDEAAISALEECQQRVSTMALIHERLYDSQDMETVEFNEYAKTLVSQLFYCHGKDRTEIVPTLNLAPVHLTIDQAIPCGLILNELVTNALKYAYPNGRSGPIKVTLEEAAGLVTLVVADEGVGLHAGFKLKDCKSLGLSIVDVLAKQLGGSLAITNGKGAAFAVRFTKTNPAVIALP